MILNLSVSLLAFKLLLLGNSFNALLSYQLIVLLLISLLKDKVIEVLCFKDSFYLMCLVKVKHGEFPQWNNTLEQISLMFSSQEYLTLFDVFLCHILILNNEVFDISFWSSDSLLDFVYPPREGFTFQRNFINTIQQCHFYKLCKIAKIVWFECNDQLICSLLLQNSLLWFAREITKLWKFKANI